MNTIQENMTLVPSSSNIEEDEELADLDEKITNNKIMNSTKIIDLNRYAINVTIKVTDRSLNHLNRLVITHKWYYVCQVNLTTS